ncbi:roadblock/LC7 domain-containing protein [Actinoplanes sichuanensis]|uniref:Roadblock/LC7 domain-containing protein n=1 Tax=Actinoplanes sichuanensis TaxID=512349 RepID=A0ABW4A1V6_9ACTN|nr:roadblock/LC7 domain-containing protein [Actinoplanes sichuanensis]BEL12930.1 roadblock/LC7 domain-containing protein [Actinoplanes sichuanensis]
MTATRNWGWLLDQLCDQVPGISHALAVSADGLTIAASRHLNKDDADKLAAFTSGIASLTVGASRIMRGGAVEQNVTEMALGYLIVMAIGDGSSLTVLAAKDCDLGQVSYEMAMLINSSGAALTPDLRQPQHA